jgi:SAM-dependent methyltransferase
MESCEYPLALARRYDQDYAAMGRTRDIDFYVELALQAARSGSAAAPAAVLEVACGTGRVLLPIARALVAADLHATVTGVDPSPEMRAQLMSKLQRESEAVRGRVTVLAGRFDRIPARGPFALVCSAFRAFQHVHTPAEQQAGVDAMAAVLAPGGTLAFDVFDYDPSYDERQGRAPDCAYDEGGRHIERHSVRRFDAQARAVRLELRWYADGVPTGEQAGCALQIVTRDELVALVQRSGLSLVDVYGGFDRSAQDPRRPRELVVLATKPE